MSTTAPGQALRLTGLKANIQANGDLVTFRAKKVRALVETAALPDPATPPHQVKFGERAELSVELLRSDVNTTPEIGEYLIDGDARRLRIVMVTRNALTYICECATK